MKVLMTLGVVIAVGLILGFWGEDTPGLIYFGVLILAMPFVVGLIVGLHSARRADLWPLAAVVVAFVVFDAAFSEDAAGDAVFFVGVGVFMALVGLAGRWVGRLLARRRAPAG